jgi:hypothetical protein
MNSRELSIKERISMIEMEYFILKEKMKENECGGSYKPSI